VNYHGFMNVVYRSVCSSIAFALVLSLSAGAIAQPRSTPGTATASSATSASATIPDQSALDAETFYLLLLGELNARDGEAGTAFSLYLDAARKSNNAQLYQRATEIALQARSGDSALQAANAWRKAQPNSVEANQYVLGILLQLNRVPETAEPLKASIAHTEPKARSAALLGVPRLYARASDRKAAATAVEQALTDFANQTATAADAWSSIGRMRLAAGDTSTALEAARRAVRADARSEPATLLALDMMDAKNPGAEELVRTYLAAPGASVDVRLGYARELVQAQRNVDANAQLRSVTREHADLAEPWLLLGSIQLQDNQLDAADGSLKKYIELAQAPQRSTTPQDRSRGLSQAYLAMAQVAEKRKDFKGAEAWLARIDNAEDLIAVRSRRASILAKQGQMPEARALIASVPERTEADARMKLMAEVGLLRENKQYQAAYDLLGRSIARSPEDTDLLYDQAMVAEKMDRLSEMERLLRQFIAAKPEVATGYNALGYSLADRNVRLDEARQLIKKAVDLAPGDPFIADSLGWVEFRLGNKTEALRILEAAYKQRPDPEIAAHMGEVLWSMGERERAMSLWKEAQLQDAENETLVQTLKRLRVRL
jgi:tetratricopeptide (TPR) repeat protein